MTDLARTLLISLDRFALLRAGGKWFYRLTGQWLAASCRRLPEVRALYLTGSMASGDIAPGLSDIDIVVVIKDLPAEREHRLIRKIETRLRYVMPPYGRDKAGSHLMIYSVAEWQVIGAILLGKKSGGARVLFEKWTGPGCEDIDRQVLSLHHLLKANWRMEELQTSAVVPAARALDCLLRLRMANRMLGAMESAVQEVGVRPQNCPEFTALTAQLRSDLARMRAQNSDADLPLLLPAMWCCLDLAIGCSLPDHGHSGLPGSWSQGAGARDYRNFPDSIALARELSKSMQNRFDGQAIFVARLGKTDFFVCESLSIEVIQRISECHNAGPGRSVRFVSFRLLEQLYLNDLFGPFAFIRLNDLEPFGVQGRLSHDRFMLEAYAVFPKVRALMKLEDPALCASYRSTLQRLIEFAQDGIRPPGHDVAPAGSGFTALRQLSDQLLTAIRNKPVFPAGTSR